MANFTDVIRNIFHSDEKEKAESKQKTLGLQSKANNIFGKSDKTTGNTFNPFLKSDGSLVNPYLNYQKLLDNPNVSQAAKKFISQATGLSPNTTITPVTQQSATITPTTQQSADTAINVNPNTSASEKTQTAPVSDTGNTIVNAAQKYIGTPYVWGGESMSEGGMDCSGFVYNALKDAGYNVGRTTAQGYRNAGTSVSKADMQAGDLIFFGKDGNASHIGIYIGNGQMIHSSGGSKNTKDNPGKGVSVTNVDYRNDFLEARRY